MKILSLSYFSEIWPHSFPEYLVMKGLNEKYDFQIDYVSCEFFFDSCVVHDSRQESFSDKKTKNKICELCIDTKNKYVQNSNFNNLLINNFISKADLKEINEKVETLNIENLLSFKVFNVEIAKFTFFNYFISQKKSNINFSDEEFERFKIRLKDSLKSLYAFRNIITKNNYDYLIAFSTEYSINRVCVELAKEFGLKVLNIANGKHTVSKFKFIKISEGIDQGLYYHANEKWNDFIKLSIVDENFKYVEEYIHSFLGSKTFMNYSSKYTGKSIRKFFKIDEKYKKIVLIALSSQDERSGDVFSNTRQSQTKKGYSNFFKDDIEWCEWLLNKIERFKDTYFIIRFHPRSFPNQRNKEKSDLINRINKISSQKKQNLSFNFPDDPISVYDYLGEINLLLQSSSSMSFEFGLFGIPSLTYDKNLYYYTDGICFSSDNLNSYLDKINFLLEEKNYKKKEIIINAFKWLIIQLNYEFVNISDAYDPPSGNSDKNIFSKYLLKIVNKLQKYIGVNIVVRYLMLNIVSPKNLYMLKNIFDKNLKSNLDISLYQNQSSSNDEKDFQKCKEIMLSTLNKYPKLKKLVQDL